MKIKLFAGIIFAGTIIALLIFLGLYPVIGRGSVDNTINIPPDKVDDYIVPSEEPSFSEPQSISIGSTDLNNAAVIIYSDGRIVVNTNLDEASRLIWDFVAAQFPKFIENNCRKDKK